MLAKFEKVPSDLWAGKYLNPGYLPHWHIEHEIIHCEKGCIYVTLNGQIFTLSPGDSIYIYNGDVHQAYSDPGTVISMIVYSMLNFPHNFPLKRLINPRISNDSLFHTAFCPIYREINEKPLYYKEFSILILCQYLLQLMRDIPLADSLDLNVWHKIEEQKKLIEAITQAPNDISFKTAAKIMGYSEAYFSRYFKQTFDVTFSQFMNNLRTTEAVHMLQSDIQYSMTEIATSCGFGTIRHFNRVFKNLTGYSPSDYKKTHTDIFVPNFRMGKYFDPTMSSSIAIDYFEDPSVSSSC